MADGTAIEWCDATWNPIVGCSLVSPGCTNCYAMRAAARVEAAGTAPHYAGTTMASKAGPVWTGKIAVAPDHILTAPLRWRKPRRIFVNSMSDLFAEGVPDEVIDRVFAVMALCPHHTFQILTKRPERMRDYVSGGRSTVPILGQLPLERIHMEAAGHMPGDGGLMDVLKQHGNIYSLYLSVPWPLPNVWLGVSVEDQRRADERIPPLLATPAALRWVSAEPLLGPVDLTRLGDLGSITRAMPAVAEQARRDAKPSALSGIQIDALGGLHQATIFHQTPDHMGGFSIRFPRPFPRLDWIVAGGESGPGARPMHPDWPRALRDQCAAAGVPFLFKQWGEWIAVPDLRRLSGGVGPGFVRIGKRAAGRLLDGVLHDTYP